jgi:hypothetical protein
MFLLCQVIAHISVGRLFLLRIFVVAIGCLLGKVIAFLGVSSELANGR